MNKNAWSDNDRNEFDSLVGDALAVPVVADRRAVFLTGLGRALADHQCPASRCWAVDVNAEIRNEGADKILKREQEQRKPRVPVASDGTIIGRMPREVGQRNRDEDGKVTHARGLFDFLGWDDIRRKIDEYVRNRRSLDTDIFALRRLLTLQEMVPGTATPAEACEQLGITVEEFLAS